MLATSVTTNKSNVQVEAHSYVYDRNHNVIRRTDTTARPSRCTVVCAPSPTTFGTYTTTYGYDAYQRLISSAVYSGSQPTGTPVTTVGYASTSPATSPRPTAPPAPAAPGRSPRT